MPDEELKFGSEEEKANAIATFDESKGSESELEKIMSAKIEAPVKADAGADKPPQNIPDKVEPDKPKEPAEADKPPQSQAVSSTEAEEWAKTKGFKSFAEAKKAFDEKEKFIRERLENRGTPDGNHAALMARTQQLEAELNTLKASPAGASKEAVVEKTENKIAVIKEALAANLAKRKALVEELRADPSIGVEPDFLSRRIEADGEKDNLDLQLVEEINGLQTLFNSTTKEMKEMRGRQESDMIADQNKRMYEQEMDEITKFANNPKYPEFAFEGNRDAKAVEAEYVRWANGIASAVYASPVNMLASGQERGAVAHALELVKNNDPEAMAACRAAGVPVEPVVDVRKYLDICELLNHRDGKKINPMNGQLEQQYRTVRDPATGSFRKEAVRMASIEDAYLHRMAVDGTFQEKIKNSYVKGTKDLAAAAQKRTAAPVELDNASGASALDAGLEMPPADALKLLETIDEQEALRLKMAGDSTMSDKLEKALSVLEMAKT